MASYFLTPTNVIPFITPLSKGVLLPMKSRILAKHLWKFTVSSPLTQPKFQSIFLSPWQLTAGTHALMLRPKHSFTENSENRELMGSYIDRLVLDSNKIAMF